MKTIQFRRAVAWLLMLALSVGNVTQAVALTLATTPLAASTTSVVRPNLMYVLDDSGSMGWDYTPDYVNDATITDSTNLGVGPPGSSGDTGSVTIVGGVITAITAVGGNTYGNGTPTAVIMGAGAGAAASVTMNTTTNKIQSVSVTAGGSGYVAGTTFVTFVGGLSSSGWGMCWGTTGGSSSTTPKYDVGGAPFDTSSAQNCSVRSQMPYSTALINYQYYDPAIRYLPPLKADGTSYVAASTSSPTSDGFAVTGATANLLTTGWQHEVWCSVASPSPAPTATNMALPLTDAGHPPCRENADTSNDNLFPNVTYTFRKTYNGPAFYFTMDPSEYCSSSTYTSCVTTAAALASPTPFQIGGVNYTTPSRYRWCSYYNPFSKSYSTDCQGRRDLDHYVPNYLGGWLSAAGSTGLHSAAILRIGETNPANTPGTTAGQQITGLSVGGVSLLGGLTFTSASNGDQNTVATNICNAIQANTASSGYTCSVGTNRVTIEASAIGTVADTKPVLVSGPNVAGANSIGSISVRPDGVTSGLQMSSITIFNTNSAANDQLLNSTVTADGTRNNTAKRICDAINAYSGSGYSARANTIANLSGGTPSDWGTCLANDDGYLEIKRNATDDYVNGQTINTAGPASGTVSNGSILITSTSGATSITNVTLDTDGAAGPLAPVSILTGGTLNIADGTLTTAIATALAAKIGGSGCTGTASSATVTISGCTCTAASCPIVVTSPSAASTATLKVTSTTHANAAALGGIQVNGVDIAGTIPATTLTNGQSVSANAASVRAAITQNGFSAGAAPVCVGAGDLTTCNIVVTAPAGTAYNGKSFTFLAGTASSGVATSPIWNFRITAATADNALLEHIRCDASDSSSGDEIYALSADASTGTATSNSTQRTANLASGLNGSGANGYSYSCSSAGGDDQACHVTGPTGASACTSDLTLTDMDGSIVTKNYSKTAGTPACAAITAPTWTFRIKEADEKDKDINRIRCGGTHTVAQDTADSGPNDDENIRRNLLATGLESNGANGYVYVCNSDNRPLCTLTGPVAAANCTSLNFSLESGITVDQKTDVAQTCPAISPATSASWDFTIDSASTDSKFINSIKCGATDTITVATVETGITVSADVTRINNLAASIEGNAAGTYPITCGRATATDAFADCTITGPAGVNACQGTDTGDSHNCGVGTMSFKYNGNDDGAGMAFSATAGFSSNDTDTNWRSCLTPTGNGTAGGTVIDNFAPYLFTVSTFSGGAPSQVTTPSPVTSTNVGPILVNTVAMSNQGAPAVTAIPTNASGSGLNVLAMAGGADPDPSSNNWNKVGIFKRHDLVSGTSYSRESGRTDCVGATCTYAEELQNFANWYSYYRTRMLMMKSATTQAFSQLDSNYRVGYDNICNATGTTILRDVAPFTGAARTNWWSTMTSESPSCATPLRAETAKIGRYFAGKVGTDPMEYSCQQNYMILVTDGYWNESDSSSIKGVNDADIGNTDNSLTTAARPYFDGQMSSTTCPTVGSTRSAASSCRTLADIAWYFYSTDLRTVGFGNATNGTTDVGTNNVLTTADDKNQAQHMNFFAMGLGIDGKLAFQSDYQTASTGDYAAIVAGSKNWPAVSNLDPTGVDDLWHATVNGHGKYFSARNVPNVVAGLREALNKIGARVGSAAAAATSNLEPVAGDNFAYVASYATVDWTGDLQSRSIDVATGDVSSSADCTGTGTSTTISGLVGVNTITVGSATDLVVGSTVTGTGIASGAVITAISGTTLTLSVNNSGAVSGTGAFKYGCQWSAQAKLDNLTWSARKIYMAPSTPSSGAALRLFTYANLIGATEQGYFAPNSLSQYPPLSVSNASDITASNLVDFLRGNRGLEQDGDISHAQIWRRRQHVFGDIVNTQPVYMKAPSASYTDTGYSDFKTTGTAASRKPVVFVSSQDGMLHAINAHTASVTVGASTVEPGGEMWAFVPTQALPNLKTLADVNYPHRYFVDGQIAIADVDFGSGDWHTILVGGQGAGGTSYYALDVTNPVDPKYLWEFTNTNLGYTVSNSIVSKLHNGEWAVFFSSGYNNDAFGSDGDGYLFAVNPETGAPKSGYPIATGSSSLPSNLGKIAVWADAPSTDNTAQYVYAGDLNGDLWRFDLDHTNTVAGHTGTQVFKLAHLESGGVNQPITTKPELTALDSGTRVVVVGTGKYLETTDLTDTTVNGFYAIKDTLGVANLGGASQETWNPTTDTTTVSILGIPTIVPMFLTRKLISQDENNAPLTVTVDGETRTVRKVCAGASSTVTAAGACNNVDNTEMDWTIYGGWYTSFPDTGERMNVDPKLVRGTLVFATNVPAADSCTVGGQSWANFLDYSTGLSVAGATTVSIKITDSLVVGITVVKLASGDYKAIATKSNYQQETLSVPVAPPPGGTTPSAIFGGKRGLWREYEAYQ